MPSMANRRNSLFKISELDEKLAKSYHKMYILLEDRRVTEMTETPCYLVIFST